MSQLLGGVGGGFTTIAAQLGCQSVVGHQGMHAIYRPVLRGLQIWN